MSCVSNCNRWWFCTLPISPPFSVQPPLGIFHTRLEPVHKCGVGKTTQTPKKRDRVTKTAAGSISWLATQLVPLVAFTLRGGVASRRSPVALRFPWLRQQQSLLRLCRRLSNSGRKSEGGRADWPYSDARHPGVPDVPDSATFPRNGTPSVLRFGSFSETRDHQQLRQGRKRRGRERGGRVRAGSCTSRRFRGLVMSSFIKYDRSFSPSISTKLQLIPTHFTGVNRSLFPATTSSHVQLFFLYFKIIKTSLKWVNNVALNERKLCNWIRICDSLRLTKRSSSTAFQPSNG